MGGAVLSVLSFVALRNLSQPGQKLTSSNSISLRQYFQSVTVMLAALVVWNTELNLQSGLGLPYFNSVASYILLFFSVGSFLYIPKSDAYDFVCEYFSPHYPHLLVCIIVPEYGHTVFAAIRQLRNVVLLAIFCAAVVLDTH